MAFFCFNPEKAFERQSDGGWRDLLRANARRRGKMVRERDRQTHASVYDLTPVVSRQIGRRLR